MEVLYQKFMATVSVAKPKGTQGRKGYTHEYKPTQLNQHVSPLAATYFTSLMSFSCVILSLNHFVPLSHLFCTLFQLVLPGWLRVLQILKAILLIQNKKNVLMF